MNLIRRFANLFACCSLVAVAVWATGCANETEEPAGNGGAIEAPEGGEIDGTEPDAGLEEPGDDLGSSTGAGTDIPDPLPEAEPADEGGPALQPEPEQPEPEQTENP